MYESHQWKKIYFASDYSCSFILCFIDFSFQIYISSLSKINWSNFVAIYYSALWWKGHLWNLNVNYKLLLVDGHDSGEDAEDGEYIAAGQRDGGQQVVQVIRGREGVRQLLNLNIIFKKMMIRLLSIILIQIASYK